MLINSVEALNRSINLRFKHPETTRNTLDTDRSEAAHGKSSLEQIDSLYFRSSKHANICPPRNIENNGLDSRAKVRSKVEQISSSNNVSTSSASQHQRTDSPKPKNSKQLVLVLGNKTKDFGGFRNTNNSSSGILSNSNSSSPAKYFIKKSFVSDSPTTKVSYKTTGSKTDQEKFSELSTPGMIKAFSADKVITLNSLVPKTPEKKNISSHFLNSYLKEIKPSNPTSRISPQDFRIKRPFSILQLTDIVSKRSESSERLSLPAKSARSINQKYELSIALQNELIDHLSQSEIDLLPTRSSYVRNEDPQTDDYGFERENCIREFEKSYDGYNGVPGNVRPHIDELNSALVRPSMTRSNLASFRKLPDLHGITDERVNFIRLAVYPFAIIFP